jgi:hypothetical protein
MQMSEYPEQYRTMRFGSALVIHLTRCMGGDMLLRENGWFVYLTPAMMEGLIPNNPIFTRYHV